MASDGLSKMHLWAAMLTLLTAEVVASLEGSMLYSALPTIAREYGDFAATSWLITAYTLMTAASAALGGRLGDIIGRRTMLIAIMLICACGSLLSALSTDLILIIVGRAIQGVTGAILPLCYGIARSISPPQQGPTWIGVLTGGYAGSAALGYILGGMFADSGAWQSLFWLTALLPLLVVIGVYFTIPKTVPPSKTGSFDLWGGILFAPAIVVLLLGLQALSELGIAAPQTLALIVGGAVLLAGWLIYEWRHPAPLIDVKLLGNRQVAIANLLFVTLGLGGFQLAFILMPLLQQPIWTGVGLGVTATIAGFLKLPSNLISAVAGPTSGLVASRYDARAAAIVGGVFSTLAWIGLTFFHASVFQVVLGTIVAGFGSAMTMAAIPNLILEVAPEDRSSEATGLSMVVRGIFVSIGTQVLAVFLSMSQVTNAAGDIFPSEDGYFAALLFIAVVSFVGTIAAVMLPRRVSNPGGASST